MCWSTGREPMAQPPGSDTAPAEARQQRPQHQDGGAHGLDQVVRRLGRGDAAGVEVHAPAAPRAVGPHAPMLRSSLSVVLTSCRRGTLAASPARVSSAAHSSAAQRSSPRRWRLALEPTAAADQEFVHEDGCVAASPPGRRPAGLGAASGAAADTAAGPSVVVGRPAAASRPTRRASASSSTGRGSARAFGPRAWRPAGGADAAGALELAADTMVAEVPPNRPRPSDARRPDPAQWAAGSDDGSESAFHGRRSASVAQLVAGAQQPAARLRRRPPDKGGSTTARLIQGDTSLTEEAVAEAVDHVEERFRWLTGLLPEAGQRCTE